LRAVAGNQGTVVTMVSDGLSEADDVHGFSTNYQKWLRRPIYSLREMT